MADLTTVITAISAATEAVGLMDKIWDQVDRFISGRSDPGVPRQHRQRIVKDGDSIVSKKPDDTICQRITAEEMSTSLTESQLRHIKVLEKSMENHYSVWASVYPELALAVDPISKAKTEQSLKGIVQQMKGDLEGILQFLVDTGLHLDDHYMHIRDVARSV